MIVTEHVGENKLVKKFMYNFGDAAAEAVIYKYPTYAERTVICCSTQSGCPVGCRFCGAGKFFVRNLTSEEIVAQVDYLFEHEGISYPVAKLQIMFMSMGEPLLNWKQLEEAIKILNIKYPNAALLISTSAPKVDYSPINNLSVSIDKIGLQFSVHESTNEARDALVPFRAKLTLEEIADQGELWHSLTGRKPYFNYCAHEANSSSADADRLYVLFDPKIWNCTISVVCEKDETVKRSIGRQRTCSERMKGFMEIRGFDVRLFDPAGQDDIGGGCGQLWYMQQWAENNPRARRSVGA